MTKTVRARLQYMVGGLLYSPAINVGLAEKIDNGCFPCLTSMAFCLEDSIRDEALEEAEAVLSVPLSPDMEKKGWDGLKILKKPCITRYIIKRHLAFLICSNNYLKTEQERRHSFGIGTWGHQF